MASLQGRRRSLRYVYHEHFRFSFFFFVEQRFILTGFTSSGIVAAVSAPISEQKITVFYMSAYRTDWLLVRGVDFEAALKQLEHKFTVIARS